MKSTIFKVFGLVCLILSSTLGLNAQSLKIDNFTINGGEIKEVSVFVDTSSSMFEYIGFQFDLFLPLGLTVESASLSSGLNGFTLQQRDYSNGTYRFAGFSGSAIPASSTSILNLKLRASEDMSSSNTDLKIQNIVFSAANGQDIKLENSTTTANIYIKSESIVLSAESLTLLVGQKDVLTATVEPENTTDKTVTWNGDNSSVISVGTDGTVTALSAGTAKVTATCGEKTAICMVTVKGSDDITVKPGDGTTPGDDDDTPGNNTENGSSLIGSDLTLRVNQSAEIELEIPEGLSIEPKFEWNLNAGGAELVNMTVNANTLSATFRGLKVGETGYTVSIIGANGNIEAAKGKIKVIAERPISSLELDPASLSMAQNALPQTIKPVYTPENATMPEFSWTSSVPTVATVSQNGVVTPVGQGETVITATAKDGSGLSATCKVTVTAPIDENFEFEFDESVMGGKEGISLYIGETYTFTPKAQDGYVLPDVINWSSSDAQTVSVDSKGKITALKLGKVTVTASATVNGNEVKAICEVTVLPITATQIKLSANDLTLLVGQRDVLTATVEPDNTTDKTITWSGDNSYVISVGTDGSVTALSAGIAKVTASCGEIAATCTVTVKDGGDITITPGDDTPGSKDEDDGNGWIDGNDVYVHVNRTVNMNLSMPEGLTETPTLTWKISNGGEKFVKLTPAGNTLSAAFTGLSVGETSYTVSLNGKELLTGKVTVIAEITMNSLHLEPATLSMAQNALPQTIKPVYAPENATMPEFNWTSSVPTVATVSQEGVVTPVGQGETVITITAKDGSGLSATSRVTVTAPVDDDFGFDESVMGGVEGVTIFIGESYTIVPKAHEGYQLPENIVWSSSDENTVSVDQNGTVTGVGVGSATISATATINGKQITASCTVNVIPVKVSALEITPTSAELEVAETLRLNVKITPDDATTPDLQWTTNAPAIASVSQDGIVTALMIGEANITARTTDGSNLSVSCLVKVVPTLATGIEIVTDDETTIKATETVELTAIVTPSNTTDKRVSWRSENPEVATVNESGVVTGISVGEATITATNSAGQTAQIKITVIPTPVESIELNRYTAQLRVQDGFRLTATVRPTTATDKSIAWSSSSPEIVSVDNDGNILALQLGEAIITAMALDGSDVKAECRVTVTITATSGVSVTADGPTTLKAEQTVQLRAVVLPETTTDKSVRWQSDNPDVATVDRDGLVTAISVGTAIITVTNSGGQTASITITVIPTPVESIELNKSTLSMKATESFLLIATVGPETATDKSLTWSSDNEAVAKVNQNGEVSAIATGEAIITATANDGSGVNASCRVMVTSTEVTNITITANGPTTLQASQNVQLTATIMPETATDKSVVWEASAPEIADVNENGLVTAYAVGESVITATSSSGLSAQITITVIATPVSSITLSRSSMTMRVGNERQLTATVLPETATDKSVTWSTANPDIATVDENGMVKAILEGQTSITCTANDGSGVSASCIINVVDTDVETVTITAEGSTTLRVAQTVQLRATVEPATSTDQAIVWSSANPAVASVDQDGLVTAVSEGNAVITATTANGLTDQITITVIETQVGSITLNEESIILLANETFTLIPDIRPTTASNKQLSWASGNNDVATVSQDGVVTAVAVGETVVTATSTDGSGVTASCRVTVIPTPATSITITAMGETTLEINQTVQLIAEVLPLDATDKTVTWNSSNKEIATVTETGLVTALTAGQTVITATNSAGQYDRVTITVIGNEPDTPDVPEVPEVKADTPTELLRKGNGTSHTFVAMMELGDEALAAQGYRYVFGYSEAVGKDSVIEDTPFRYAHTTGEVYWNDSYDFWVLAYYVDESGKTIVSSRRHLDGSVDDDFDPESLIGQTTKGVSEYIIGIYTLEGQYLGKDIECLDSGVYIVRTNHSSYKTIK